MCDDRVVCVAISPRDRTMILAMAIAEGRSFASEVTVVLDGFLEAEAAGRRRLAALEDVGVATTAALEDVGVISNDEEGGVS